MGSSGTRLRYCHAYLRVLPNEACNWMPCDNHLGHSKKSAFADWTDEYGNLHVSLYMLIKWKDIIIHFRLSSTVCFCFMLIVHRFRMSYKLTLVTFITVRYFLVYICFVTVSYRRCIEWDFTKRTIDRTYSEMLIHMTNQCRIVCPFPWTVVTFD